jgi:hypothetical protein
LRRTGVVRDVLVRTLQYAHALSVSKRYSTRQVRAGLPGRETAPKPGKDALRKRDGDAAHNTLDFV